MGCRTLPRNSLVVACLTLICAYPQQPKPAVESPAVRLESAKNVLFTHERGNNIPFEVIKSTLEGWGRFILVEKRDQADLVIQVSTSGGDNSVSVSSSSGVSPETGKPEQSSRSTRDLSSAEVTMTVFDAKNKRVLWIARDTAKFAVKEKTRENNLVEAAERLASKFHDRLEPPPPKDAR